MTAWDDIRPVVQGEPQEATRAVSAVGGAPGVSETHTDPQRGAVSEAQHVIDAVADQMWQGIVHEPGFLLREWGGGQPCHVAVLFLMDHEQRVQRIIHRGDLPSVWRAPKPQRPSLMFMAVDEGPVSPMFDIVEWKVRNVYAWLGVASHYLPGYPHDNQFMVRFAAGLYEIPPPATTENQA